MPSDTAVPRYCAQCGDRLGTVTVTTRGQELCTRCAPIFDIATLETLTPSDDAVQEAIRFLDDDTRDKVLAALAASQREAADLRGRVERLEIAIRYAIEDGADLSDPGAASVYPTLFALAPQTAGDCDE